MKINPRRHHEFPSEGNSFKLVAPLVVDEHQVTSVTVINCRKGNLEDSQARIQITSSDPLSLTDGRVRSRTLDRRIAEGGNDTLRIKTKPDYSPPSGMEGDCVVQGNITARSVDERGVILDSIGLDILVRRKIISVFTSVWKTSGEIAKFVTTSAATGFIAALISMILGRNVSEMITVFFGAAIVMSLLTSFLYSWSTREKFISNRLKENRHYLQLIKEVTD